MPRTGRRRKIAVTGSAFAFAFVLGLARPAAAEVVGCDAGVCRDDDGDGFPACGCAGLGSPCDCDDADPATFPGAPERCDDTKNRDCSGDAGLACAAEEVCFESFCTPRCAPLDDFGCAVNSSFFRLPNGACVCKPSDCSVFGCPPGLTCDDDKECIANCHPGVRCPRGQICRGFGCVDPCAGVVCQEGAACVRGRCVPSCACAEGNTGCAEGMTCDRAAPSPTCVETACVGVSCSECTHCEEGRCVDDCEGVVCPPRRVCRKGDKAGGATCAACIDLCSPNPCKSFEKCDWRTGECRAPDFGDGGLVSDSDGEDPLLVEGAGFACSSSGIAGASALAALGLGGLAAIALARRRRTR